MITLKRSFYYNWLCECIRAYPNKRMDMTLKLVSKDSSFLVAKRLPMPMVAVSFCSDDASTRIKVAR